ncbi:hypothetical protein DDE20_08190 [Pararhodobacter oceanensis]|uniref:Uncharacterized protein n=1 Tax=Pararhodobacter oceanensis TaxID=2172121 RepID=A0A2T8HUC4_9RHOB|nr:hypothetical protein DDE20_08190 [Pararhodobacter oceanensis]
MVFLMDYRGLSGVQRALATSERSRPRARSEAAKKQQTAQAGTFSDKGRLNSRANMGALAFHARDYTEA